MARNSLKNVMRLIDTAKDMLPVEQDFLSDLKRSIELEAKNSERLPSKTYKPSGMNCIRQSYYQLTGTVPDNIDQNYTIIGICNSGTDIHLRIQTAVSKMKELGMECEYVNVAEYVRTHELTNLDVISQQGMETKLYHNALNMSFLCDGIIKYRGHYYILEIKTESSYKFMNRKAVDPSHYNQATAYSIAFGINDVLFIYINRDVLDMKAFLFTPTNEMKQDLIGYIEVCNEYIKSFKIPPKPDNVAKKTCGYCIYKDRCSKEVV